MLLGSGLAGALNPVLQRSHAMMSGHYNNQPVFILGNPRSGTSLIRLMLTSHPDVVIPPESGFIVWLHEHFSGWSCQDADSAARIAQFVDALVQCRKFDTWEMDPEGLRGLIARERPASYGELCRLVYYAYAEKFKKAPTVWGDKNNFHVHYGKLLAGIYPGARFLHIVRDGRDVACSYREVMSLQTRSPYAPSVPTEIRQIAREWTGNIENVELFLSEIPPNLSKVIKYEDLVCHPESVLSDICEWLGILFDGSMLEYHNENRRLGLEPGQLLDWKKKTLEPVSVSSVGRYLSLLSTDEIHEFEVLAKAVLVRYGYVF